MDRASKKAVRLSDVTICAALDIELGFRVFGEPSDDAFMEAYGTLISSGLNSDGATVVRTAMLFDQEASP